MGIDNDKNKNTAAIWAFWGTVIAAIITGIVTLIVANKIPFIGDTSSTSPSPAAMASNPENARPIYFPETPSGSNSQSVSTPLVLGKVIFDENFDNNNNGWPTGKNENDWEAYLDSDEYHIIEGGWLGTEQLTNIGDFYLETKTRRLEDSQQSSDYGVYFRRSNLIN